jgi:hypothetical protein
MMVIAAVRPRPIRQRAAARATSAAWEDVDVEGMGTRMEGERRGIIERREFQRNEVVTVL